MSVWFVFEYESGVAVMGVAAFWKVEFGVTSIELVPEHAVV